MMRLGFRLFLKNVLKPEIQNILLHHRKRGFGANLRIMQGRCPVRDRIFIAFEIADILPQVPNGTEPNL